MELERRTTAREDGVLLSCLRLQKRKRKPQRLFEGEAKVCYMLGARLTQAGNWLLQESEAGSCSVRWKNTSPVIVLVLSLHSFLFCRLFQYSTSHLKLQIHRQSQKRCVSSGSGARFSCKSLHRTSNGVLTPHRYTLWYLGLPWVISS